MNEFGMFFFILDAFWEALGPQALCKIHQKSSKTLQKSILRRVLDTSAFEGGFSKGFGKVLGGSLEGFLAGFLERLWNHFWKFEPPIFGKKCVFDGFGILRS